MKPAALQRYCLAKPGAWLDQPWEGDHVAKVGQKIFAFVGSLSGDGDGDGEGAGVGLKCGRDRDEADEWLRRFPGDARVMPYIGRFGWNTLSLTGAIPDDEIREAVDASYEFVVAKLPKAQRPPQGPANFKRTRPWLAQPELHPAGRRDVTERDEGPRR